MMNIIFSNETIIAALTAAASALGMANARGARCDRARGRITFIAESKGGRRAMGASSTSCR